MKRFLLVCLLFNTWHMYAQVMRCDTAAREEEVPKIQQPEFNGDLKAYLARNTCYPASATKDKVSGKVYIGFYVETDGSLTDVFVLKSFRPDLDTVALDAVSHMPKWKPAIDLKTEKAVRLQHALLVTFKITEQNGVPVFTPKACRQ